MVNKNLLALILVFILATVIGVSVFLVSKNLKGDLSLTPKAKKDIVEENPFPSGIPGIEKNVIMEGED